jgi:hypothetical protein
VVVPSAYTVMSMRNARFPKFLGCVTIPSPYTSIDSLVIFSNGKAGHKYNCINNYLKPKIFTLSKTFFLISKNSLKSAEGRNPSTQGVYKGAPN